MGLHFVQFSFFSSDLFLKRLPPSPRKLLLAIVQEKAVIVCLFVHVSIALID